MLASIHLLNETRATREDLVATRLAAATMAAAMTICVLAILAACQALVTAIMAVAVPPDLHPIQWHAGVGAAAPAVPVVRVLSPRCARALRHREVLHPARTADVLTSLDFLSETRATREHLVAALPATASMAAAMTPGVLAFLAARQALATAILAVAVPLALDVLGLVQHCPPCPWYGSCSFVAQELRATWRSALCSSPMHL